MFNIGIVCLVVSEKKALSFLGETLVNGHFSASWYQNRGLLCQYLSIKNILDDYPLTSPTTILFSI